MKEYENHNGINIAVIYRKTEYGQTMDCPFCQCSHKHGIGDGHRVPHCITIHKKGLKIDPKEFIQAKDGVILRKSDGYILKTIKSDE